MCSGGVGGDSLSGFLTNRIRGGLPAAGKPDLGFEAGNGSLSCGNASFDDEVASDNFGNCGISGSLQNSSTDALRTKLTKESIGLIGELMGGEASARISGEIGMSVRRISGEGQYSSTEDAISSVTKAAESKRSSVIRSTDLSKMNGIKIYPEWSQIQFTQVGKFRFQSGG
jgi:hypothetical protein